MAKVIRSIKNVTKGYSSTQIKVRNATSNDPWGPVGTEMSEIAQITFNSSQDFYEVMDMLDKRLNDKGKNWRHPLKALKVLDYALHEGSELVVTWARKNIDLIETLREFQYIDEDGRDVGQNVRLSAKKLTRLILDDKRLMAERNDRKSQKSGVTGIYESDSHARTSLTRRPQRAQRTDEEDAEYRLAIEASKYQEEEDRKARQSRRGEPDDGDGKYELATGGWDSTPEMSATYIPGGHQHVRPSYTGSEVVNDQNRLGEAGRQHGNQFENEGWGKQAGESVVEGYAEIPYAEIWKDVDKSLPRKIHRHVEDPEITAKEPEDFAQAEKAGLALTSTDTSTEDQPKPKSLKERIALLQKQPAEQASRHADAAAAKGPRHYGGNMPLPDEDLNIPRKPIHTSLTLVGGQLTESKPGPQISGIEPSQAKSPIAIVGDLGQQYGNVDQDQPVVHPKPTNNSKRTPLQVEYMPANSQTQQRKPRSVRQSEQNDSLLVATPINSRVVKTPSEFGPPISSLEPQTTASTGNSMFSSTTTEMKLGDYFKDRGEPFESFTDLQCGEIARLLVQSGNPSWSTAPRIYIVLRLISQLQRFDAFLDHGVNDLWLPFSKASLPAFLDLVYHEEFLKQQTLVLTKAINLENGSRGHAHFTRNDPFPFEVQETLGEGGFGYVDKIVSPLSGRVFARKRFRRPRGQKKTELESFMNELKILKRLHHIHCVSLVASYTDPKYFGIIIAPVADCDLAAFYSTVTAETTPILRSFFGCLANAMNFLHEAKIRHRDIKPQNILVKGSSVYLTDFGISLDWENLSRSTTTKDTAKSMLYCAPEVARYEKRNTSADIWSLGCVFLEMLTVINGKTLEEQRSLFKEQSGNYRFFDNTSTARDWTRRLRGLEPENEPDALMSDIILEMLQENADDRIPTAILCDKISRYQPADKTQSNLLCAECCIVDTLSISDSGSDRDPFEDTT